MRGKQSRFDSFLEATTNTLVSSIIYTIAGLMVLERVLSPLEMIGVLTVVSIAKNYAIRRAFRNE